MKKTLKIKGRKLFSIILAVMLVLSTAANVSVYADWTGYDGGSASYNDVYLQEKWIGGNQQITYYSNGNTVRTATGGGNTLWIDSWPKLETLYDTCYWCFDIHGNIFAIDVNQKLLVYKPNFTEFRVNTSVSGCTGFQRDQGKFGYLVYTNSGASYSLESLLRGNNNYNNGNGYSNGNNNSYYNYEDSYTYPYVSRSGNYYYFYTSSNRYYAYYLSGNSLYYKGTNSSNYNTKIASSVKNVTFYNDGYDYYVVYATTSNSIYGYEIGETSSSYRKNFGSNFSYFDEYNYISSGYYTTGGSYRNFSNNSYYYDDDNRSYDYDRYPYVSRSSNYYYFYTSSNRYYTYYLSGNTLYFKGTNSSSNNMKLATSVDEITFYIDGYSNYIVYALNNGYVYGYPIGQTSSSSRKSMGNSFSYFDEYNYISEGYYNTNGSYRNFSSNSGSYYSDYPYVEKSGNYYYFYVRSNRYYTYYLSGSTLYYKGMNSSNSNIQISTGVEEITFATESDDYNGYDGYIVYANSSNIVYGLPLGKTTTSYRVTLGRNFSYFDESNYISDGYYNRSREYVWFDF